MKAEAAKMFFENRFTLRAESVLKNSHECAARLGHGYVGSEHILMALSAEKEGKSREALLKAGITQEKIQKTVCERVGKGRCGAATPQGLTPCAKRIVVRAYEIAGGEGKSFIGEEHIFLAMLKEEESEGTRVLCILGGEKEKLMQILLSLGSDNDAEYRRPESFGKTKERAELRTLKSFGRDMCALAREGKFDPVIGRERELLRMVQILSRRTKNNPILLGNAGVGKTALVEGLAQMIANKTVPSELSEKKIYSVDISSIVAGTKYRGEFEERIKAMFSEVAKAGDVIIFIDEIHTIVGAGAAEGAIDAANILKPALSRREVQIIGATTFEEYRKHIERDAALVRRFQAIEVDEPSEEECIKIIEGLAPKYEKHHSLAVSKNAISAAVTLSKRYLPERKLPDKAIDLIDEALSKKRIEASLPPQDIQKLEDKIALAFDKKRRSIEAENFEEAAIFRDEEERLKLELMGVSELWKKTVSGSVGIDSDDIAEVISEQTEIPVKRITKGESARLRNLEDELSKEVIGQSSAISALARAIRASRCGLSDETRPIGSFLFAGPTGVGKTKLSIALAESLFDGKEKIIRLDMSEYMEKSSVSKIIGAPPGYVGYEEKETLVDKVRKKPYCVVLVDEIEKAHPDILNILLQILDEGRLTDSHGKCADFKNCVIIMTSNIGAKKLSSPAVGFSENGEEKDTERLRKIVVNELKTIMTPELIGRIDEVIVFSPLSENELLKILDIEIKKLISRAKAKGIELFVSDDAREVFVKRSLASRAGARELSKTVRREIYDKLSEIILDLEGDACCVVYSDNGEIRLKNSLQILSGE